MRCDAWVQTLTYTKGRKRRKTRLVALGTVSGNIPVTREQAEGIAAQMNRPKNATVSPLIRCGGELESNLHMEYAPYWGGSDTEVVVEFKCSECGAHYYPALPQTLEDLNAVLTEWVANYQPGGIYYRHKE